MKKENFWERLERNWLYRLLTSWKLTVVLLILMVFNLLNLYVIPDEYNIYFKILDLYYGKPEIRMPVSNPIYKYRIRSPIYGGVITERADMGCERLPCNITTNFIVNTTEFPLDEGDVLNITWTGMLEKSEEGLILITCVMK